MGAEGLSPDASRTASPDLDTLQDPRELVQRKFDTVEAPKDYIEKFKISGLFLDLLTQLSEEQPEDPHTFCLTWLRFHRHRFEDGEGGDSK
eukprot:NODE_8021_length_375_cov_110.046012_g6298_i0.p3 GENE.NODE_8021_length_375_cov_110.046012_g6298_i0~~NODE_8021_length_375_cov_110.046012_g6298_i0.p3  ORF type:complete len:91 (-),score=39.81 NODE_8021_length_375_cov_110.046012_g6298_i0:73-345(-)